MSEYIDRIISRNTDKLAQSFRIPEHLKGRHFFAAAVLFSVHDRTLLNDLTGRLYPAVAEQFGTTSLAVERAMRNAVAAAWSAPDSELHQLFQSRPRNGELVRYAVNFICGEVPAAAVQMWR